MEPLNRLTAATADVLHALVEDQEEGGVWGLRVIKRTGRPAGTVYPILERLEGAGWVSSSWEPSSERRGPRRRHYELTADGRTAAVAALSGRMSPASSSRRTSLTGGAAVVVA